MDRRSPSGDRCCALVDRPMFSVGPQDCLFQEHRHGRIGFDRTTHFQLVARDFWPPSWEIDQVSTSRGRSIKFRPVVNFDEMIVRPLIHVVGSHVARFLPSSPAMLHEHLGSACGGHHHREVQSTALHKHQPPKSAMSVEEGRVGIQDSAR